MVKAYLRIVNDNGKNYHTVWMYDHNDPDENSAGSRVQSVSPSPIPTATSSRHPPLINRLVADKTNQIRAVLKSPQAIWSEKSIPDGVPYLIRASYVYDEDSHRKYYVAIGTSLAESRKLLNDFTLLMHRPVSRS